MTQNDGQQEQQQEEEDYHVPVFGSQAQKQVMAPAQETDKKVEPFTIADKNIALRQNLKRAHNDPRKTTTEAEAEEQAQYA